METFSPTVVRYAAFGRENALIVAYFNARPYGSLNAVLMKRHHERRGQLIGLVIFDANRRVDTAQDMRLDGLVSELLLDLREHYDARLVLIAVLCGEDFLNLIVQVVSAADLLHAFDHLIVVDAFERRAVDVVLLVGAAERVERHLLDRVGREVELRLCGLDSHVGHNGSAFIGFVKMKKAPCIQRLT